MLAQHAQRSLETAAIDTLERIQADQRKVNGRLRPLLEHIEQHLFDPGLDVNQLKRRCGVRDNSIPIQFHAQIGQPPHAYIESRRLETACRLLRDTDLRVWQIASLLGYSSIQVFSRAFTRWGKVRPTSYRRQERRRRAGLAVAAKCKSAAVRTAEPRAEAASLERALDGKLEARQADRLIRRLLSLYPATRFLIDRGTTPHREQRPGPTPVNPPSKKATTARTVPTQQAPGPDYSDVLSLEEVETARAEVLWERIKDLPLEEMRAAIRSSARYETKALFEAVRKGGLKQGRDDRQRGIEDARLLVDLATNQSAADTEEGANMAAHAWVWVGNAKRLAQDLVGAEASLEMAESLLPRTGRDPEVVGNMIRIRADVRMYQRRYGEAIAEVSEAIGILEKASLPLNLADALNQRAEYRKQLDQHFESIKDVHAAMRLLGDADAPHTRLVGLNILAQNYSRLGETEKALDLLLEARSTPTASRDTEYRLKLLWLEAEIASAEHHAERAERLYGNLIDAFARKRRANDAAFAAIDLARMYWGEGLNAKAAALFGTLIPVLKTLNMASDALAAIVLLSNAAEASDLTRAMFEETRRKISKLPRD